MAEVHDELSLDQYIIKGLNEKITARAEKILQEHKADIERELEEAVQEELAKIALSLAKTVSVYNNGMEVRITISDARKSS